jgi:predicted GNAT superfamily acetyltransferase
VSTGRTGARDTAGAAAGFTIRPMHGIDEFRRCVELQQEIWGAEFSELVPAAILWVASRSGGIVSAAFRDSDGAMAGFIFGLTGYRDRQPMHWSDMLAIREDARGYGLGIALKQHQRRELLAAGVNRVAWTFDPLESRNAWINFARLGIRAREYIVDCYGHSDSPLHQGLGTDRLVAGWVLDSPRVRARMDDGAAVPGAGEFRDAPVINPGGVEPDLDLDAQRLRLQIPADIQEVKAVHPGAAEEWRRTTRAAFQHYLGSGYEVVELVREAELSSYLLERGG